MVCFMGILYINVFCWFIIYIYIRYYGQVKKHENVSAISNLVVGKEKHFGFFGDVM